MGNLPTVEHDVLDAAFAEDAAHGEAGVTGTDDDDVDHAGLPLAHYALLVVTATSVGLVITSNTAERFCDWATRAAISSALASASIS